MTEITPRRGRGRLRHRGHWVLVDANARLLAIGSRAYPGLSAVSGLDLVARRLLVPLLRTALTTGSPGANRACVDGQPWSARAVPLPSALTTAPVAALGIYEHPDQPPATAPTVGTWEWDLDPNRGRFHWAPQTYFLHGHARTGTDPMTWPRWLDEHLALGDRIIVRALCDAAARTQSPQAQFADVIAITGDTTIPVRVTARGVRRPGRTVLVGTIMPLSTQPVPTANQLPALLSLSRDQVYLVDPVYEVVYLTGPQQHDFGLRLPRSRSIPQFSHPDDLAHVRSLLRRAVESQIPVSSTARFAGIEGWTRVDVTAAAAPLGAATSHVWLCVRPAT
ncbi:hypothetical protein [Actinokineospora enzanensis]|uniref:hypothetical protein n=1 Tax=Actinokineospora enzanensis TaxID=155975 RepID=UPI000379B0E3|nr:hypothetical protein [Actinokineospora enzanensis]